MESVIDKVAFITGGVSGIGLGMARVFAEAGMKVIVTYMSDDHLANALSYFNSTNSRVHAIKLDVTDRDAFSKAADMAEQHFGKVHLLCNNAGIGIGGPLTRMTYKDWDWGLDVNLNGVINGIMTFLPRLISHGEGGHILTTSSISGLFATPNTCIYNTAKFAVMGLMETLRGELAPHRIGVSVACPGVVNTNLSQSGRLRPQKYQNEMAATGDYPKSTLKVGMDPVDYALKVLEGIRRNDLFILTHPEFEMGIRDRFEAILRAIPKEGGDPEREAYEAKFALRNTIYIEN